MSFDEATAFWNVLRLVFAPTFILHVVQYLLVGVPQQSSPAPQAIEVRLVHGISITWQVTVALLAHHLHIF